MRTFFFRAKILAIALSAVLTPTAHTQTVAFPDSPLQTSSNISVKPNLLFVLDDSGSMNFQYTRDEVSSDDNDWRAGSVFERMCYDSGDNNATGDSTGNILGFNRICKVGDVPFMASFFNTQYYNPAFRYRPGVNADGTSMQSQDKSATSSWTSVKTDAYGVSKFKMEGGNSDTVNLTQFPERVWCNSPGASTSSTTNCKLNTTYQYPNAEFPYGRDDDGDIKYRYGQPYSWSIPAFEHCTASDMKDCVVSSSPTTQAGKTYSVPSRLRYCKYTGGGTLLELNKLSLTDCQAKMDIDGKYTYPRFLGKVMPSSALLGSYARIQFSTSPTVSQNILTITVDGVNIIDQTFSGYTNRQALATAVANSINNKTGTPEFRACAGGSTCNTTLGITGTSDDSVYIYPVTASGGTTRLTGAASNNFGAPVVNGSPAGPGVMSKTIINVASLGSPGLPPVGGLGQITVGSTTLLSGSYDNGDLQFNTANTPASVAVAIANAINNSSQNGNFQATPSGSTVVLERKAPGPFFDGTAVTFSYTNVARAASITGFSVAGVSGSGTKNVAIRLGTNNTCSADTINVASFSSTTNSNNTMGGLIRSAINGQQGMVASGSNAAVNVSSANNADLNGWYLCFTTSGTITNPGNKQFNTNGRSAMSSQITAPPFSGGVSSGPIPAGVTGFQGGADFAATAFRTDAATWTKTVIATGNTYAKSAARSDCAGSTCTYDEEMTNFANWYAYYRTRMQSMKSSAGQAFSSLSDNFRVGFTTINDTSGSRFIKIRDFNATQKTTWYSKFYETGFNGATPLRQALSRSSRVFSGIVPFSSSTTYEDPVQYSCQQNFVLLTTDGYWNESGEDNIKKEDGTRVDNADGASGVATPFFDGGPGTCPAGGSCLGTTCHGSSTDQGKFSSCNTLSDVAFHFATTDLRRTDLSNCSNQSDVTNTNNLCTNDVKTSAKDAIKTQHVTMFSLGLGVDGTLAFQDDYETAGSGDYAQIRAGTLKWPQVKNLHPTAVDDLWHAAVNGKGKYFSAKDPESLSKGLKGALAEVNAQGGAGAAAATSNLEPITGDNFAYVASYTTVKWTGNLEARQINLSTGQVSVAPEWCAENVLDPVTNNISCTGTMSSLVQGGTDTRAIFTYDSAAANKLKPFLFSSLSTAQKAFFAPTALSQYSGLDSATQAIATAENLVNYLRGQKQYENRSANTLKAFRERETVLADVIGSQPIYVKKPAFTYNDSGYSGFVSSNAGRSGTVYIGANDGMLHAFDAVSGTERWAYIPTPMLPKMRQLADYSYPTNHRFFVDGSPKVGDVYTGSAWKTILVGGYSSGGVGYYALDITDPHNPKALWEFPPAAETDAGASYSAPIISKLSDGTWAVIVSSGYNNSGQGYVYVLNAMTGAQIRKVSTGVGTLASPSGLGRLTGYAPLMPYDNTTTQIYGGDLKGNLWRINPSTGALAKIAELKDATNAIQPITTKVELVNVDTQVLLYVGTGKYLETGDLSSSQVQSFYGIRDRFDSDGTITDPRATLNQVTLVDTARSGGGADRTSTGASGNILTGRGWYADFPISGERINIDPQFVNGTVVVLSNIPSNTACTAGGNSYINFFNYSDGNVLAGSGDFAPAIVVGFVTVKVGNSFIPLVTRADSPNPQAGAPVPTSSGDTRYRGKRVSWKELNTD
ncbi:MAG: PilC/PilY family type IV pilus protein [Pseudomonadota bacterium]